MQLQFHGAAGTVTGSMHVVRVGGKTILLDCGLFQGHRQEARDRNCSFPVDPKRIDAVVLSHAHIDHSGNLPQLYRQGFRGPIYCTPATRDLCAIMLADSAFIQERDAEYLERRGHRPVEPLYTVEDATAVLEQFVAIPYRRDLEIVPGITAIFYDAGHILGSAITSLTLTEGTRSVRLGFTGDLGRARPPILRSPQLIGNVDVFITESTYGGVTHDDDQGIGGAFAEVVNRTTHRGGKVVIPAFSVGRTQDLLYLHHLAARDGRVAKADVYVDSPLSRSATSVYRLHPECFREEIRHDLLRDPNALGFESARYVATAEDSRRLNDIRGPAIIISASGMCEGGRILHHLANTIEDPRNTLLFVGFQAPDTLGRRIVDGDKSVRILGDTHPVAAEVVALHGLSAHADGNELVAYAAHMDASAVSRVFLVHGEGKRQLQFADLLRKQGFRSVDVAGPEMTIDL